VALLVQALLLSSINDLAPADTAVSPFSGIVRYAFTAPRRLLVAPLPGTDAHPWSCRLWAPALGNFHGSFWASCDTRLHYPLLSSEYDILDVLPAQVTMLA
jgi:hypothetical protein